MKISLFSLCLLLSFTTLFAQDSEDKVRVKEAGITFSSLNNFGLTYRIGNQNAVWRFNSLFFSGGESFNGSQNSSSYGGSFNVGREHRKNINETFQFRFGADLSFGYSKNQVDYDRYNLGYTPYHGGQYYRSGETFTGGLNFILGMNYAIKNSLIIGAEVLPYINYIETKNDGITTFYNGVTYYDEPFTSISSGLNYGIMNQSVILSIVYRY